MTKTPEQVKLILIDPKMVELQLFKKIPHLLCPVVTNMKKAPGVLEWCVAKMEERYDLFSKSGVNHIKNYNELGEKKLKERLGSAYDEQETPLHLPYLVLIVDELADLISVAQQEVEGSIQRLAQKSRAVGIHVILATQSPRREVITGIIKANLPCKIGFKVSNKLDSRVILDSNGAEKLLGHGDLLYIPPGTHRLVRAQGTYVSEREIRGVVDHLEQHASPPRFEADLLSPANDGGKSAGEEDDLYEEAVKVVLGQQRGSATLLQRALEIGYTRASRLLELMERDGLVGPFVGSKSREVFLTFEQWESEKAASQEARRLVASGEIEGPGGPTGVEEAPEESVEGGRVEG
jgi:S-DNA-T family DNA segregation ATPase FtsK/SpoIIIE